METSPRTSGPNALLGRVTAVGAAAALGLAALVGASPASASTGICVGGPGCYDSVQAAVDAAPAGSTVRIGRGTFAGGITITKSLSIVGAGERRTAIQGGGPVVTVQPAGTPTVVFTDLTIRDGLTHGDGAHALGGGINAPSATGSKGATLILRRVHVTGNRTEPTSTVASPSGLECTSGACPYAFSAGAGVATSGDLTLEHVTVDGNAATGTATDAWGGGVYSDGGDVTVIDSNISGNRVEPLQIGIYAEGGGLMARNGTVSIVGTRVTGNTVKLVTTWPVHSDKGGVIDQKALGGGLKFSSKTSVTIARSVIDSNEVTAIDPKGEPVAFSSGIEVEGTLDMRSSSVSHNSARAIVATSADVGLSGDTIEMDHTGTLRDVQMVDNHGTEISSSGPAQVATALSIIGDPGEQVTASGLLIRDNAATAKSPHGAATVYGAGILSNAILDLSRSRIEGNHAMAYGKTSSASGGGIWNGALLAGSTVKLALHHVAIRGNSVVAPGGVTKGGGIYSTAKFTSDHLRLEHNLPDNCSGTGC